MWGSKDENPNRFSEALNKPTSDGAVGHEEHWGYVARPVKSVVEVTSRTPKWSLGPSPKHSTVRTQMFEMHSVLTALGRGKVSGAR